MGAPRAPISRPRPPRRRPPPGDRGYLLRPLSDRCQHVLAALSDEPQTYRELSLKTQIPREAVKNDVMRLSQRGFAARVGKGWVGVSQRLCACGCEHPRLLLGEAA
jgi:predicted Rossmann fold nucleotide-binding protein DprA/Smf involved in DNA uptake